MYTRCLFCTGNLGRNEALEAFPVGRRLAYDGAKGRLWVVCLRCGRWNLTPLEERWDAIEQAERLFRGTRLRASTEHVGLARVRDGTELVRVGAPLRPELAAWRYGPLLHARRRRQLAVSGSLLAVAGAAAVAGTAAGLASFGLLSFYSQTAYRRIVHGRDSEVVARFPIPSGATAHVRRADLSAARFIRRESGPQLLVQYAVGTAYLDGDAMVRVAGLLLPHVNRYGGSPADVRQATELIDRWGGPAGLLARLVSPERRADRIARRMVGEPDDVRATLPQLPVSLRLAIEMAVHEDRERAALDGELAALEEAWREAEVIAAIADNLALPDRVQRAFIRLRGPAEPGG